MIPKSVSRFNILVIGDGITKYLKPSQIVRKFSACSASWNDKCSCGKWDKNWDKREPEKKDDKPEKNNLSDEQLEKPKRNIYLIRHGQYHTKGPYDKEHKLTDLGHKQADYAGIRLACLGIKWNCLVRSTMTRAQQTSEHILKYLPEGITIFNSYILEEAGPINPEPPVVLYKPWEIFQDGARTEAAFRHYFYRADLEQDGDIYMLLVCHSNVIRYFACRALQFPPEGFLRITLNHCSMTWISIAQNGHVNLRILGETGFMDPKDITFRNVE